MPPETETMPARRLLPKTALLIAAVCCVIAAVIAFWLSPPPQSCQLLDGSKLALRKVTYGKVYSERENCRLRDYLVPFLPNDLAKKWGCNFVSAGGSNMLVFWFDLRGVPKETRFRLHAAPFDEHGCEFRVVEASRVHVIGEERDLMIVSVRNFPRRGKTVGLRLFQTRTNGGDTKIGEFMTANPDRRTFPVWQAAPLPLTKSIGNVSFTLLALQAGIYGRSTPPQPPVPGDDCGALLQFQIRENGELSSDWDLAFISNVSDATGHQVGGGTLGQARLGKGELIGTVPAALCYQESAWRFEAGFKRLANFPAEDLWIVTGVPVPEGKTESKMEVITNLHGLEFKFIGIAGKDCGVPGQQSIMNMPAAHLVFPVQLSGYSFILVNAQDNQGREIRSSSSAGREGHYVFGLTLPAGAKTVDFTFALTKEVGMEFFAKPSRMTDQELKALRKKFGFQ